jgi:hypothetical protein
VRAYTYAVLLTVVAVGLLTLAMKLNVGSRQSIVLSVVGVISALLALAAGYWATGTGLYNLFGYVLGLNEWARLIIGALLLLGLFGVIEAVLPHQVAPGASVAIPVLAVLVVLPSALAQGAIPGTFGQGVSHVVKQISEPARQQTTGWFG